MTFKNLFQSRIFLVSYRIIIPSVFTVAFFTNPWTLTSIKSFNWVDWFLLLSLTILTWSSYSYVTFLDQRPSKDIFWKGLWDRMGTFRGDKFIPYSDRSTTRYLYFFIAGTNSVLVSLLLRWTFNFTGMFSGEVSTIIAAVNFFLLFIPYCCQYQAFDRAIYGLKSLPIN